MGALSGKYIVLVMGLTIAASAWAGWFGGRAGADARNRELNERIAELVSHLENTNERIDLIVQSFSPVAAHAREDHEKLDQTLHSIEVLNRQQHLNAAMQDMIVKAWNLEHQHRAVR